MIAYACMDCRCALPRVEFDPLYEGRTVVSDGLCPTCYGWRMEQVERESAERLLRDARVGPL